MLKTEKGHFLSPELKELKNEIMQALMHSMFDIIAEKSNTIEIDAQARTDIILSCLIMFSRDIILHFNTSGNARDDFNNLVDTILGTIRSEVMMSINHD